MSNRKFCVVNCKNTAKNCINVKFYCFPTAKHKIKQREKWIEAILKATPEWSLKSTDRICSQHFIGNAKSDVEFSPSYSPIIFGSTSDTYTNQKHMAALQRHKRFMARKVENRLSSNKIINEDRADNDNTHMSYELPQESPSNNMIIGDTSVDELKTTDQECQVDTYIKTFSPVYEFTCNRYITRGSLFSDAEIQTDISNCTGVVKIPNNKKYKSVATNTEEKVLIDQEVQVQCDEFEKVKKFSGFDCIENNDQMLDLAGVSCEKFKFLLTGVVWNTQNYKINKENRLLIFLMKFKTGLTFSALGVIFCVNRTTISHIFFQILQDLVVNTANLVFWPDQDVVRATTPACFHPNFSNVRVIIDCTEFRIEIPPKVDERVYAYSHYKKTFTAKLLVGVTPSGFICHKSKVAGGRKSDSQITMESGLIDKLEYGDIVLADKGFPVVQEVLDKAGKKVCIVMPPFLVKKKEFSKTETEQTYKRASVRIHVERVMQRLRTFRILDKIPASLFHCIDDIVHICCVLVNLQPPIIAENNENL